MNEVKPLEEMTGPEQRVAIARDVIAQVKLGVYQTTRMFYCIMNFEHPVPKTATDLRDLLGLPIAQCKVCAMGALIVSKARLFGGVPIVPEMLDDDDPTRFSTCDTDPVGEIFGTEQSNLIERAFEGRGQPSEFTALGRDAGFIHSYPDPADRLVAIMENVIENFGEFIP